MWGILTSPHFEFLPFPVHPHACGAYNVEGNVSSASVRFIPTHVGHTTVYRIGLMYPSGSSPRMWGILQSVSCSNDPIRFIPTHVGHTFSLCITASADPVHPHACGAYFDHSIICRRIGGSSPRMWGILASCRLLVSLIGSSPRMWGIRNVGDQHGFHIRFIPTLVGHTVLLPDHGRYEVVHPHVCGHTL